MKGLFYLLVVFCFLYNQSVDVLVLTQGDNAGPGHEQQQLITGPDLQERQKSKKKKGKKGKHPKSQEVIIRPDGGNDIKLELDEEKKNADVNGDGEINDRDKGDLKDAIDDIVDIDD